MPAGLETDLELWRRRLSDLGRGSGKPHPPLFAPLLYGAAAQIEALPVQAVVTDPTRLCKGLTELRRVLGTRVVYTAAPAAMEAEALGASVERNDAGARVTAPVGEAVLEMEDFDDLWERPAHLHASLEATRRLAAAGGDCLLFAALTGPLTLLGQLLGESPAAGSDEAAEFAGRALAALLRQYAEAGVAAVALHESRLPESADRVEHWDEALGTIANVARFHRIPLLLVPAGGTPPAWPDSGVPCAAREDRAMVADRPHGLSLPALPAEWPTESGMLPEAVANARVIVTGAEVPARVSVAELRERCTAMLRAGVEAE